jgi:hypothetical protein
MSGQTPVLSSQTSILVRRFSALLSSFVRVCSLARSESMIGRHPLVLGSILLLSIVLRRPDQTNHVQSAMGREGRTSVRGSVTDLY